MPGKAPSDLPGSREVSKVSTRARDISLPALEEADRREWGVDAWRVVGERSVDAASELYAVLESCRSSSSPCGIPNILLLSLLPSWRVALVAGDRGLSSGLSRGLARAAARSGLTTNPFHCESLFGYQLLTFYVHWNVHDKPPAKRRNARKADNQMPTKSTTRTTRLSRKSLSNPHTTHFRPLGSARHPRKLRASRYCALHCTQV